MSATPLRRLDAAIGRVRRLWEVPGVRREVVRRMGRRAEPGQTAQAPLVRTLQAVGAGAEGVRGLAELLAVDTSTASRLADAAVAAGHLERSNAPHDRRRTVLTLTRQGEALLDRALAVREGILRELTYDWPDDDVTRLAELLDRLADRLSDLETAAR